MSKHNVVCTNSTTVYRVEMGDTDYYAQMESSECDPVGSVVVYKEEMCDSCEVTDEVFVSFILKQIEHFHYRIRR